MPGRLDGVTFRRAFEQRVGPLIALVGSLPRAVPFLVVVGLVVGGLLAGGLVGAVLLLVLAALLGALLYLAWPTLEPGPRTLRVAVVAVVAVRAVSLLA
jgi:hypothetical protein